MYLPDDLKAALEQLAAETGRSEADLIREGIRVSDDPHFAEHPDEHLAGFGTR